MVPGIKFDSILQTPISSLRNLVGLSKYLYLPVSFIFILIIFSICVYPLIPKVWGGGRPSDIKVTLTDKESQPIIGKLIYQNSDSILIDADNETYLLKEGKIEKIQYLERRAEFVEINNKFSNFLSN